MKNNIFKIGKHYKASDIEASLYEYWETNKLFSPNLDDKNNAPCYSIAIPPPNVTGHLHMGHAFQYTLMDILIRYNRMLGKNTYWQVGTDHAGIATQLVVERKLEIEEGKKAKDYSREEFVKKVWQWKEHASNKICQQMRRLGIAVDWQQQRFTMDEGFSKAVNLAFISLYNEGLIYKKKSLVNWDPKLKTAISDLEVKDSNVAGKIWHLKYKLVGKDDFLEVATTRPETLFGDVAIAVHPEDERYTKYVGKEVLIPLINRKVSVIADRYVDVGKGTGCVKITPAHDFNDYQVGKRHALNMINIFDDSACILNFAELFDNSGLLQGKMEIPEQYKGLDRFRARKLIIEECQKLGCISKVKDHNHTIPVGDRSNVVIEPRLTDQWFVKISSLAKAALKAVQEERVLFFPKQYENMYRSWMKDLQDWCISRQLWWGHRIPAWYDKNNNIYVGMNEKEVRDKYKISDKEKLFQDEDVLDTWFSSAMWTFVTLGWPEKSKILKYFHPTSVMISGFDIIFFWIARMIMMSLHFVRDDTGNAEVPFKHVYITGLIRDEKGDKMSKSKGNVIDPIDMIDGISCEDLVKKRTENLIHLDKAEEIKKTTIQKFPNGISAYGTDALRFTLAALAAQGRDINWDMQRLQGYSSFCNKLWNATRLVLSKLEDSMQEGDIDINKEKSLNLPEAWIISKLNLTTREIKAALDSYRFDLTAKYLHDFIWHQFCDWYLEISKICLSYYEGNLYKNTIQKILLYVLKNILKLAHPVIPFITEALWQQLHFKAQETKSILLQPYPSNLSVNKNHIDNFEWIKEIIVSVRNLRSTYNFSKKKIEKLMLSIQSKEKLETIKRQLYWIKDLIKVQDIEFVDYKEDPDSISAVIPNGIIFLPLKENIDLDVEINRIDKNIKEIYKKMEQLKNRVNSEGFLKNASKDVIIENRKKLSEYEQQYNSLKSQLAKIISIKEN